MYRLTLILFLTACFGCSYEPVPNTVDRVLNSESEDGGVVDNPHRDKAEQFLVAIPKVISVEEEKALMTEFGEWLRQNEYKIEVKERDGKYDLLCPYFAPETPWVTHSFLDIGNLDLLPQLDTGE
ncbi:MAG: hypothetical protein AAFN77_24190 [Planctomycetota bacterium]